METPLRLTAIILLLRPMGPWYVRPIILAIAAAMLLSPRVLRLPLAWGVITVAIAVRVAADWPLADNHIYLLCYWTLAITLSLAVPGGGGGTLAVASRWLVGLAFAFAVLWKVMSPDYLDGRFFRVTFLTDPRFGDAAVLLGDITPAQLQANRAALAAAVPEGAELVTPPEIVEPPRLRTAVRLSTYGILALEAMVAALMLLPERLRVAGLRHAALLLFCAITYAFAPVSGFGWLLLVMGSAQTAPDQRWLRGIYVAGLLAVLFYSEVPWPGLLLDWFGASGP